MKRVEMKVERRQRRRRGIRKQITGDPLRPRLAVFRSMRHMYAQIIDDLSGTTLVSAATVEKGAKIEPGGNRQAAEAVGKRLAEKAKKAGIEQVVFDRGGRRYHGRVKALAEAARKEGLKF